MTKQINDLTLKSTPAATDEIELQETSGGSSKKTTLSSLVHALDPSQILRVGAGGRFANITDAIAELSSLTAVNTTVTVTGSAVLTQYSDRVVFTSGNPRTAGVRSGDFLYVPSDAQTLGYPDHHYYVVAVFPDAVVLETGIIGAGQTLTDPVFKRLNRYAIELLPGDHDLDSQILPDGYWVSMYGHGRSSVVYGGTLETPAWGMVEIGKFLANCGVMTGRSKNVFPLIMAAMPTVRVHDIEMGASDWSASAPDMEFLDGVQPSGVHVTNFHYQSVVDHGFKIYADSVFVDGFYAYMAEESYECINAGPTNRPSVKPKFFSNIMLNRRADGIAGTAGVIMATNMSGQVNQGSPVEYWFSNVFARNAATGGPVFKLSASAAGAGIASVNVYINNCQLESSGYSNEIEATGTSMTVFLNRCFRRDGTAIRTSGTSTFTTL